jgi:cyclopropane-fatty-acyl-phospholipid synthase
MLGERLRRIVEAAPFEGAFTVVLPDGSELHHGSGAPAFRLIFKSPAAVRQVIRRASEGFGEAYERGDIDVEGDIGKLVLLSFALREHLLKGNWLARLAHGLGVIARRNSLAGSKRNVSAHYDLDNDFYRLWLDEEMQYTCAYFDRPDETLEAAQRRKMDLVCRKLDLRPDELVVEAGGGWGGLALHMATRYGARVKSFNVSAAQVEYARARAATQGLGPERLEYILDDYRNIPRHVDRCDKFASICMLEHVGRESYAAFFALVAKLVKPPGLALLQFISHARPRAQANPWLEKHVFPGYYNPSLGEVMTALEAGPGTLHPLDLENMRFHYALTLRAWLDRLEANAEHIRNRWGEAILRRFRLYLAGCLGDFESGAGTLVYQLLLRNGMTNAAPLARRYPLDVRQDAPARVLQSA